MGMGHSRKVDFLHHAPALRRLLKEPPYLWQPLSPDGGNLEHWAGGMKWWWERVGMRDGGWKGKKGSGGKKKEGGRDGVWVIAGKIPALLRKTNVWRGLSASVSMLYLFHQEDWFMTHMCHICPSPLFRQPGKWEDNGKSKMRKMKNEGQKTWTKRQTKETEKLSAKKVW